jgi:hypothetical protein
MSRSLLQHLNGGRQGELNSFLNNFKGEPRIAWYPSAGDDFRALLYLHPSFAKMNPAEVQDPKSPDIFLFTDYFPWQGSTFLDKDLIYGDGRTTVSIVHLEELPRLNLPLVKEIAHFPEGSSATDRCLFLIINIYSEKLGSITFPVIYAFALNEMFFCHKLAPYNAAISHIIHVRYGGGLGGGGYACGAWLLNVLKMLKCELFITDGSHQWQSGDEYALENCTAIPKQCESTLIPYRVVPSQGWSYHGDVSWNLLG